MLRTILKSKIHKATVTEANVDYEGSITIDKDIMEAAALLEYEHVHVLSLSSGERLETYAICGRPGSGQICMNGAAAKVIAKGEKVIVLSFAQIGEDEARTLVPKAIMLNDKNEVVAV
ncbi:MAG: aspartate 1-decarboxylase, partial [Actinomycetia bacterium]|nr:aspartate 1-decarboxylase [Actinomycetes bacterium]